eukprot:gene36434-44939_t
MVELAINRKQMIEVVDEQIFKHIPTWIIHPGIRGDRGMSSIDWALKNKENTWGVTILEADLEMDAGPIWATPGMTKSSVYRHLAIPAAVSALKTALSKFQQGSVPTPLNYCDPSVKGTLKPTMVTKDTLLDWSLPAYQVAGTIQCRDGAPGVLEPNFHGQSLYLYDAHPVETLSVEMQNKAPKTLLARRDGAVLVACGDNTAVWIGHMKKALVGAEKTVGCTPSTPTASSQPHLKLWSTQVLP